MVDVYGLIRIGYVIAFGCVLPTTGQLRDFHPLECALAERTICTGKAFFVCFAVTAATMVVAIYKFIRCICRPENASAAKCKASSRRLFHSKVSILIFGCIFTQSPNPQGT